MAFERITDGDMLGKGNVGRPDTPGVDTAEMQRILDELPREVIVPAFNRLADQLEAQTAAVTLGAAVPSGLPEDTSATVQGVTEAVLKTAKDHEARTDNPHTVTAAQTGAYTKAETDAAISKRVTEIGAGDMAKAVYDPQDLGRDVTVQTYTHTKSGTVHEFTGSGANGRALMTADVAAGDTFTVNGAPVTAYVGAESAVDSMAGSAWSGKWVSFVFDGTALNFKGGGGRATVSGLSADAVKTGITVAVKQGGKTVQTVTGTFTSDANAAASQILSGCTAYVKGNKVTGTIASKAAATYTPKATSQTIAAGQYLSGAQTIQGDANLQAANILSGKSIFGVGGALTLLCWGACEGIGYATYWNGSGYPRYVFTSSAPNSITFSGTPKMIFVMGMTAGTVVNCCGKVIPQDNTAHIYDSGLTNTIKPVSGYLYDSYITFAVLGTK